MQSESDSPEFWSQRSVFACVSAVVFKLVGFVERTAERSLIWDCLGMHVQLRQTAKQLEAASYKWNMGVLHRFWFAGLQWVLSFDARCIHSSSLWNWYITALHAKQHQRAQLLWIVSCFGLWVYLKGWSLTHIPRNKNTKNARVQKRIYHPAKKSNFRLEFRNKKAKLSHLLWNVGALWRALCSLWKI